MFRSWRCILAQCTFLALVAYEVGLGRLRDELLDILDHRSTELVRINSCQGGAVHDLVGGLENTMPPSMSSASLRRTSYGEVGLQARRLLYGLAVLVHCSIGALVCSLLRSEARDLVLHVGKNRFCPQNEPQGFSISTPRPSSTWFLASFLRKLSVRRSSSRSRSQSSEDKRFADVLQGPQEGDSMRTSGRMVFWASSSRF